MKKIIIAGYLNKVEWGGRENMAVLVLEIEYEDSKDASVSERSQ